MADTLTGLGAPRTRIADLPEVPPGIVTRALVALLAALYGPEPSFPKFRALELIARVPYQAWEAVAYRAITGSYPDRDLTIALADRIHAARHQHDNEHRHLVWIEEICIARKEPESWWRHRLVPRLLAHLFYALAWIAHSIRPTWSYHLNAELEDVAERDYLKFVERSPQLEAEPCPFPGHASLADLIRAIAKDEREHKLESLARCAVRRAGALTA